MPYFFSTARREGFEGSFSLSRASAIFFLDGESIAVKLSLLSRVEVATVRVGDARNDEALGRAGRYKGLALKFVIEFGVSC
jgi:hypothetical protein